jgi:hypothetical protein
VEDAATPYKGFDSVLAEAKDDIEADKAHRKMKYEQYVQVQVRDEGGGQRTCVHGRVHRRACA